MGTVSGVEMDSVMISCNWTGPGGIAITTDSRVTINATTSSGNNYVSILHFAYLMEGDKGAYMCNVMILDKHSNDCTLFYANTPVKCIFWSSDECVPSAPCTPFLYIQVVLPHKYQSVNFSFEFFL